MPQLVNKTVKLNLVGEDGNIFNLIGLFQNQAKKEGWSEEEIEKVINAIESSENYDIALSIIVDHCSFDEKIEEEDEEELTSYEEEEDEDGILDENDDWYDEDEY